MPTKISAAPVKAPPGINFAKPPIATSAPTTANAIAGGRSFVGRGARGGASGIGGGGGASKNCCSFGTLIGSVSYVKTGEKLPSKFVMAGLITVVDTERGRLRFHAGFHVRFHVGPAKLMRPLA